MEQLLPELGEVGLDLRPESVDGCALVLLDLLDGAAQRLVVEGRPVEKHCRVGRLAYFLGVEELASDSGPIDDALWALEEGLRARGEVKVLRRVLLVVGALLLHFRFYILYEIWFPKAIR